MRILVIADDLTGALDTGVQFTQWGYQTQLTKKPTNSSAEVTIINTDTRNKTPTEAYQTTYDIVKNQTHDIIYKKTDSTLRGNPGQEIKAILDATGETRAILSPSYPPTGRKVKDGHLYIDNKPITDTEYIREYNQKTSFITEILQIDTLIHVKEKTESIPDTGIIIIDSETEKDLLAIATNPTRVLAGSAGLADALCNTLRNPPPVLTIVGTTRNETKKQVIHLSKRLETSIIPLNTIKALNLNLQPETLKQAKEAIQQSMDVVITSNLTETVIKETQEEAKRLNISPHELEIRITDSLAQLAEQLLTHPLSGIIITGGATALAITKRLGIKNIEILDEVQPGIPVIKLDKLPTITKAGGFGQQDSLIQSIKYLKRRHR
jgi:uncharacterized protein YgbK (DUF1537 family)